MLEEEVDIRGFERYLADGENPIYATRKHAIVLIRPVAIWVASLVGAFALGFVLPGEGRQLGTQLGGVLILLTSLYVGYEILEWRKARYLLTDRRVLAVEGIISRRISTIPLAKVTETKYTLTVPGRILGYGVLLLDTPGENPGLDTLYWLPDPDIFYKKVMSMVLKGKEEKPSKVHVVSVDPGLIALARQGPPDDDTGPIPRVEV
jgi:hypothetical protein